MRTIVAAAALVLATFTTAAAVDSPPDSLVEAERAFSRLSVRIGHVPAFLAYFADDVVTFQPAPTHGKDGLRRAAANLPPTPTQRLDWEPWFAQVSAAGDMGYTTGPTVLSDLATGKPLHHGWYFSVWKHDANGWRVIADIGTSAPAVEALRPHEVATGAALADAPPPTKDGRDLLALEQRTAEKAASAGLAAAYETVLAPAARLHREGQTPMDTRGAIMAYLGRQPRPAGWRALDAAVSASGDLGFTYGLYDVPATGTGSTAKASFLHVWRRAAGGWLLAADIVTP